MHQLDSLFVRRPRAIKITPFTPDRADKTVEGAKSSIHYIKTREGLRLISEGMFIAEKSDTYRHPMDPDVFNRDYVSLMAYESAFVEEFKAQIAMQLRKVAILDEDPRSTLLQIADELSPSVSTAALAEEHE